MYSIRSRIFFMIIAFLGSSACVSAASGVIQTSTKPKSALPQKEKGPDLTAPQVDPPKIQIEFQNLFARDIAASGPKSEGWALFSDSPMGHNGQNWIIKSNDPKKDTIKLCFIKQGNKECSYKEITANDFSKRISALKNADKLPNILPTTFDGISFEYLHVHNSNPNTIRTVFITSDKPFPAEYEALIKALK